MASRDQYAKDNGKQATKTGPVCPRYQPASNGKTCKHFNKGGSCKLKDAFLCVEWMKAKGYDDSRVRDGCLALLQLPVDAARTRHAHVDEQKAVGVLVHASEEHIAELEAIDFTATLDVPHLGGVRIVNRLRPDGTRQLTIRQALLLAAVTAAFPGATVSELVIMPQPGPEEPE
jgi:hypothetical protein